MRGVLFCVSFLIVSSPLRAETYLVRPDGTGDFPTIQAAVNAAADGDVIELADGTFTGDGNRDVSYLGKAITIRSRSGNPTTCIIDCEGSASVPHRGFVFENGEDRDAVLERVSITRGFDPDPGAPTGSAVRIDGSSATVSDCRLYANHGVAISARADFGPGEPAPLVTDCVITGNCGGLGGGVRTWGDTHLELIGCTISGNRAERGGGIHAFNASAIYLERTIIWGNCAVDLGDEIFYGDTSIRLTCCDVDTSGVVSWLGWPVYFISDNVFVDPVFCDPTPCGNAPTAAGDYRLDAASLCLPAVSPCGERIGALDRGCSGTVPATDSTWGTIKAMFVGR